jgi:hypothetical protein
MALASFTALCLQLIMIRKTIGLSIFDYAISWLPGLILAVPVLIITAVIRGLMPGCPMAHLTIGLLSWIIICGIGLSLQKACDNTI